MNVLWVALGAAAGAPARYLIDRAVQSLHQSRLPWGTWTVNVLGSLILGFLSVVVAAEAISTAWASALGVGFCGALTTYSTFGYETVHLLRNQLTRTAVVYVAASIGVGLIAAVGGGMLAAIWWR